MQKEEKFTEEEKKCSFLCLFSGGIIDEKVAWLDETQIKKVLEFLLENVPFLECSLM